MYLHHVHEDQVGWEQVYGWFDGYFVRRYGCLFGKPSFLPSIFSFSFQICALTLKLYVQCVTAVQFHPAINRESAESECQLQPLSPLTALGYGASVIFDMAILISMLLKKASAVSYPPGSSIKARVAYVTVATASNFFFLTIHALGSKLENVKAAAQPFATVITVVIGARLFMMQDPLESQHSGLPFYRRNTPGRPQSLNPLSILYVGRQSPTILVTPPTAGNEGNLKSYPVNISGATQRPDTPFSSYDYYDSDSEEKPAKNISKDTKTAYITRETVVIID